MKQFLFDKISIAAVKREEYLQDLSEKISIYQDRIIKREKN